VKTTTAAAGSGGFYITCADKDLANNVFSTDVWTAPGTTYTLRTNTYTVPAGKAYCRMSTTVRNDNSLTWWFDDVLLQIVTERAPQTYLNTVDSTSAFQVKSTYNATALLGVDTLNGRVGINTDTTTIPAELSVSAGSDVVINANTVGAANNILQLQKAGVNVVTVANSGATTLKNASNSTTAFQIQNSSGTTLLTADTTNLRVSVGSIGTPTGQLYVGGLLPTSALGSVATSGSEWSLAQKGNYLFSAKNGTSMVIYDVSNPAAPVSIKTFVVTGAVNLNSIVVNGNYAILGDGTSPRVFVVNISNPLAPVLLSTTTTTGNVNTVRAYGNYVYTYNTNNSVQIIDISNPSTPRIVSSTSLTAFAGSADLTLAIQGSYLYATMAASAGNGKLVIYDISNPAAPVLKSTTATTSDYHYNLAVQGRYVYVIDDKSASALPSAQANNTLQIFDAKDISAPISVGNVTLSGSATGVPTSPEMLLLRDRTAYFANVSGNVLDIINIASPTAPTLIGSVATGTQPVAMTIGGRYAYVENYTGNTIQSFDIGGSYEQSAEIGDLTVSSATFTGDIQAAGSLDIKTGLLVGGSSLFAGSIGAQGPVTISPRVQSANVFSVNDPTGAGILSVDSSAYRVGVGTIAPATTLDVQSNQVDIARFQNYAGSTGGIVIDNNAGINATRIRAVLNGSDNDIQLLAGGATRLTVQSNGNVGIGAAAPSDLLEVYKNQAAVTRIAVRNDNVSGSSDIIFSKGATGTYNAWLEYQNSTNIFRLTNSTGAIQLYSSGSANANLSIAAASGSSTFRNTTDSTTAFQVQNSAGASLLNVDTLNNTFTANAANIGKIAPFATGANALPADRRHMGYAYYNGYIYLTAGATGGVAINTTVYAKVNADGSTGAWVTSGVTLAANLSEPVSVASNGYLYVLGGDNGAAATNTVYYAKINTDGSIGSFVANTNNLPTILEQGEGVVSNGYIYYLGGTNGTSGLAGVYYAKLNPDGSTGAWTTSANSLPAAVYQNKGGVANGYVYVMGGLNAGSTATVSTIYYAKLNTNGTTSTFSTSTIPLPAALRAGTADFANGNVYYIGGDTTTAASAISTVYYAPLSSTGNITTAFTTNPNSLPAIRNYAATVVVNGYIYEIGGSDGVAFATTVYYGSASRASINASLDLVGISGTNLAEGGTGGSLTAGNTNVVGQLFVQDATSLNGSLTVGSTLAVNGTFSVINTTVGYAASIQNLSAATNAGAPATSSDGLLINLGTANASRTTGNYFVGFAGGGTVAGKIQGGANAVAYTTTLADYAEHFKVQDVNNLPQPGELVALDPSSDHSVHSANVGNGQLVGVISTSPGFIGNGPICKVDDNACDKNYAKYNVLVALNGQVPTKVSVANGAIKIGDPITSSSRSGIGQKATKASAIVGFALEPAAADGTIKVVIQPQFFDPTSGSNIQNGSTASLSALNVAGQLDASSLNISGQTSLQNLAVSGSVTIAKDLTVTGTTTVADIVVNGHIITAGKVPSTQIMVAAGPNATAIISGNDTSGTITIMTGDAPVPATKTTPAIPGPIAGQLADIIFSTTFKKAPQVSVTPTNADAANLRIFRTSELDRFSINTIDMPKPLTVYIYDYFVRE
jgi:hypothetical protein